MRWNTGTTYKNIRKNKGLSQNDICGSSISRTTLSKFENNKLSPSYDTMTFLLRQIDMSDEEFQFICNDYKYDERTEMLNLFFGSVSNIEFNTLISLQKKGERYLQEEDDIYIDHLLKIIKSLQILGENKAQKIDCLPKIILSSVWQKIEKMDEWYYSEIRLLNCFMYYFPLETVLSFLPKLLKSIDYYNQFASLDTVRISILLNIGLLLIQKNCKNTALPILKDAIKYAQKNKRFDYLGIAKVRYGICLNNKEEIEEGLSILHVCGELEIREHLINEKQTFCKF